MRINFNFKKIIILYFIFNFSNAQNDYINHRKYWFYKSRMLSDFMKVGISQGDNLIFNERGLGCTNWNTPSCNYFKMGDATSTLGHYLAVLSTEYALLKLNNQPVDSVLYQLYCALYTLNRLDLAAEKILGCNSNGILNGFIARDDVPSNYVQNNMEHFNYYGDKGFMSNFTYPMVNVESDYYNHYEGNNFNWDSDDFMFMSQDQIFALLYGLMHVRRLVLPFEFAKNKNGSILYFQDNEYLINNEANHIINRIINFSRNPYDCGLIPCSVSAKWTITNPSNCISLSINVGSNFGFGTYIYPLAEIQCRSNSNNFNQSIILPNIGSPPSVCGPNIVNFYHDNFTSLSFNLWQISSSVLGTGLTDGNGGGLGANAVYYSKLFSGFLGAVCNCMFTGGINFTSFSLNNISMLRNIQNNQSYYYYYNVPYTYAILFNKNVNDQSAITPFIDVINYMNPCVHFDFGNGNFGNPAWATDTRIEHLERLDKDEFLGEYPGYDYLLYHNLWYLYHKLNGTNGINTTIYDFSNPYINFNGLAWPGPLPFNLSSQIPLKLDFYENLKIEKTRFHLKSNEFGYIRVGKSIVLKPGTYITYKNKDNPNVFNGNCGVRLYTKRYNCTDDWGSYDDNSNSRLTHKDENDYIHITDSILGYENNMNQEYWEYLKNNFKSDEMKENYYSDDNKIIYPNPFDNSVNVTNSSDKRLIVYDIFGKIILSKELTGHEENVDMSGYSSGVYFFKINDKVIKVVKN